MKPLRTTTRTYDAAGAGNGRVLRIVLLWKVLGLGGLARNPKATEIAGLGARHRLGRVYALVSVRHERRWREFLRGVRQRRAVIVRRAGLIRDKLLGRLPQR